MQSMLFVVAVCLLGTTTAWQELALVRGLHAAACTAETHSQLTRSTIFLSQENPEAGFKAFVDTLNKPYASNPQVCVGRIRNYVCMHGLFNNNIITISNNHRNTLHASRCFVPTSQ